MFDVVWPWFGFVMLKCLLGYFGLFNRLLIAADCSRFFTIFFLALGEFRSYDCDDSSIAEFLFFVIVK